MLEPSRSDAAAAKDFDTTARAYEELLAPAVFRQWAHPVMEAAHVLSGQRVLDVACGTGVLTREVLERVKPGGAVIGVDLNPAMLNVASQCAPEIEFREAAAETLPFEDASFDAVVSQFGLMFFTDRPAGLREMHRVLMPGARMAVAVFDSLDSIPAYEAVASVYERVVGSDVGAAMRFPFSLGDKKDLHALCEAAGGPEFSVTTHDDIARFENVEHMIMADVRGWFPFAQISLSEDALGQVLQEAKGALRPFTSPDGSVEFELSAHIISARKD